MNDELQFFVPVDPNAPLYIAIVNQFANTVFAPIKPCGTGCGTVPLPQGVEGADFAVLTTFSGPLTEDQLTDFGTFAGPVEVVLS